MNRNSKGQLKDVIKQEYVKCASDPIYFLKKYCVIQHPIKGKVPFNLYDFQESTVSDLVQHRFNIILKARQLGISTLSAGYSLWMMLFHNDKNILVIATGKETAKTLYEIGVKQISGSGTVSVVY